MSGKGSRRRAGANDKAFKAAPWPPPSPLLRKLTDAERETLDSCKTQDHITDCHNGQDATETGTRTTPDRP